MEIAWNSRSGTGDGLGGGVAPVGGPFEGPEVLRFGGHFIRTSEGQGLREPANNGRNHEERGMRLSAMASPADR